MGLTANRVRTTTSNQNNAARRRSGFTLIEILLVLAIISMVMAIGLPAIARVTLQRLNSTTRQYVGLVRTIRNDAILLNKVYRLVIDLDKKQYWVEEQSSFELLPEGGEPRPDPKKKAGKGKAEEAPPSNFAFAKKYSTKPKDMPGGVEFTHVLKEREGVRNDGTVYVHFFPNGFVEQSILYIAKEGAPETTYSIVIRPTGGRVDIYREIVKGF